MELEFLGTGTSTGVPMIGCNCEVCKSTDYRDTRMRTSAIVRTNGINILIDCGPDFRSQMLRASDLNLDAVLLTHSHYDHVGGIDDIRPYSIHKKFPIYAEHNVAEDLRVRIPYCFTDVHYPGVPEIVLNEISLSDFYINDVKITPLRVLHYKLPIVGYKIGNLAYITDALTINDDVIAKMKDVDTLVINALRIKKHVSHQSLSEALENIKKISPRVAYLIHMSHDIGLHCNIEKSLPDNVHLAYDGLILNIKD